MDLDAFNSFESDIRLGFHWYPSLKRSKMEIEFSKYAHTDLTEYIDIEGSRSESFLLRTV